MRVVGIVVAVLAVGCVRTHTEQCGDFVCPDGTTCTAYGDLTLCVSPDQLADCQGLVDGDACGEGATSGFCRGGACLPIGCGNGRIDDPIYRTDEECDDGNRISHDGCSSTCRDEQPRLEDVSTISLLPFTEETVVTDTSSGEAFLFGGSSYGVVSARSWKLVEGTAWRQQTTLTGPSARQSHAAAYDQHRQRVVMFGGGNIGTRFADTWEYDGTAWTAREPMTPPPGRQNHAMAYDPIRGVTVMFGGRALGDPGDTWEWDGTDWHERVDAMAAPITRVHQAMAFDPGRGVMVMIIETNAEVITYELADDGWHEVAPGNLGPLAGARTALAYDAVERRILASADSDGMQTVSAWDGQAWTSLLQGTATEAREAAAMTTSLPDGRVIRVGGNVKGGSSITTALTQRWTGTQWEDVVHPTLRSPPLRTLFATAYDPARHRVVLFGGLSIVGNVGDTWELGPTGWTKRADIGPTSRTGHAMVYDATRGQIVLFGDAGIDRQTWLWDGSTWTSKPAVAGLEARMYPALAHDPKRGVVVMFGGSAGGNYLGDTWEWNGETWTKIVTATRPGTRGESAMAYDPIRERVILFGGRGVDGDTGGIQVHSDTWEWDGTTWTRLDTAGIPTARFGHTLVWDAARGHMLLVGGQGDPSVTDSATRDVWEWNSTTWTGVPLSLPSENNRVAATPAFGHGTFLFGGTTILTTSRITWSADTPYETCTAADHDRDGLVGCADPDCWSVCTPTCVPGETCDANGPRCGDGACSAIETCSVCPADCGPCPVLCGDGTCSAGEDCVGDCTP